MKHLEMINEVIVVLMQIDLDRAKKYTLWTNQFVSSYKDFGINVYDGDVKKETNIEILITKKISKI